MNLIRIERLLEPINCKVKYALTYIATSKYKYFYDNNTSHEQNYTTYRDIKAVGGIKNVLCFSDNDIIE